MAANITQYETLRNPQFASGGMVNACALRKMADMERKGLKLARKAAGLTQQQIADRMGVSVPQVSRWENGVDGIPSQRFASLQRAYEAGLSDLFSAEEDASHMEPNARPVLYRERATR